MVFNYWLSTCVQLFQLHLCLGAGCVCKRYLLQVSLQATLSGKLQSKVSNLTHRTWPANSADFSPQAWPMSIDREKQLWLCCCCVGTFHRLSLRSQNCSSTRKYLTWSFSVRLLFTWTIGKHFTSV